MSFQAMTWAVEQELPAMQKIVLLMMANRTNHDTGLCFPSHDKLAKECGMSKSSMIRQIKEIERNRLIEVIRSSDARGLKSVNKYRLKLNKKPSVSVTLGGSVTDAHKPVTSFNQEVNQVITTRPENFDDSIVKLNAVQYEVYVWASSHNFWHKATTSEEDF